MKTKTYRAQVKALGDTGEFEAVVSVFGNVDYAGDRVVKGAFADSLKSWQDSGDPIPVVFSHQWDNIDAHIGYVNPADAVETDQGLQVKGVLDIDEDPAAAKIHRLLKGRRIREFSFAYDVVQDSKARDGATDLEQLDIIELGPTLKGMNPATQLIGAKARDAGQKVYTALSGSIEERQQAIRAAVNGLANRRNDEWAYVEATFDDHVVFVIETSDGMSYWQADYTITGDGTVELGDPIEVDIDATVTPKSGAASGGPPANLRANVEAILKGYGIQLPTPDQGGDRSTSDQEAAKSTTKPEEPATPAKGEESSTRSPSDVRLLADINALDLVEV